MPPRKKLPPDRLVELANNGLSAHEIAAEIGMGVGHVRNLLGGLTASGKIPRVLERRGVPEKSTHRVARLRYAHGKPFGTVGQMVDGMPVAHVNWMMDQVPAGGSVADLLRALVADAYAEATQRWGATAKQSGTNLDMHVVGKTKREVDLKLFGVAYAATSGSVVYYRYTGEK